MRLLSAIMAAGVINGMGVPDTVNVTASPVQSPLVKQDQIAINSARYVMDLFPAAAIPAFAQTPAKAIDTVLDDCDRAAAAC